MTKTEFEKARIGYIVDNGAEKYTKKISIETAIRFMQYHNFIDKKELNSIPYISSMFIAHAQENRALNIQEIPELVIKVDEDNQSKVIRQVYYKASFRLMCKTIFG